MDYKGYTIKVEQDTLDFNPRTNFDPMGTMVCFHSRHNLGDEHDLKHSDFTNWDMVKGYLEKHNDIAVILPLYLYDHSGITMNTTGFSCRWDSGQVGFIYITKKQVREEYGRCTKKNLKKAEKYLIGEVKEYDDFITGNVWYYEIEKDGEHVDSCGGFIGDKEYCETEAKSIVDNLVAEDEKKHGVQMELELV